MYNLKNAAEVNSASMENMIFDACRANPKRESKTLHYAGADCKVEFVHRFGDEYMARVSDAAGVVLASAIIDKYDV